MITKAYECKDFSNAIIREWPKEGMLQLIINGCVVTSALKEQPYNYKNLEDMKGALINEI